MNDKRLIELEKRITQAVYEISEIRLRTNPTAEVEAAISRIENQLLGWDNDPAGWADEPASA